MQIICVWIVVVMATLVGVSTKARSNEKPNVLMIIVDDMNDWVGCLGGHPDALTPNIDRLAKRGVLFSNAHCAAPVCNASRVATLTGLRPSSTGIYDNSVKWHQEYKSIASIPRHFRDNGYEVAGGGKVYHHMPGFNRDSDWDIYFKQRFDGHFQRQLHSGKDVSDFQFPTGFPLNGIAAVKQLSRPPRNAREFDWGPLTKDRLETGDGKMVKWATDFLRSKHESPFLLVAGIYRPHLPFYAPEEYFERLDTDSIKLPRVLKDDIEDLPATGKAIASGRREDLELVKTEGKYREMMHAYLASTTFADDLIGDLLAALEDSSFADNTIVVLWSDHGWHFGEKDHLHKMTLWDRATRVPFIIAMPEGKDEHKTIDAPVSLIDLFPTLNAICGLPAIDALEGRNLRPLIEIPDIEWDEPVVTTHGHNNHAVRSRHWRYIRYADGGEELYDHRTDPDEWHNLASRPEASKTILELREWIPKVNTPSLSKKRIP